jgi:hypothetical protein
MDIVANGFLSLSEPSLAVRRSYPVKFFGLDVRGALAARERRGIAVGCFPRLPCATWGISGDETAATPPKPER